jgi:hypothetical protein
VGGTDDLGGVRGTLIAQSGNSLDKSLLLGHLLKNRGLEVRIAGGKLGDEKLSQILAKFRADLVGYHQKLINSANVLLDDIVHETDEKKLAVYRQALEQRNAIMNRLAGFYAQDLKRLEPGLVGSPEIQKQNLINLEALLKKEAKTHYWLQVKIGGNWTNLDPTFELPIGECATEILNTHDFDKLPEDLFYNIRFEINALYQERGEVQSVQHLSLNSTSAALSGIPLFLIHPANGDSFFAASDLADAIGGGFGPPKGGIKHLPIFYLNDQKLKGSVLVKESWKSDLFSRSAPEIVAEVLTVTIKHPGAAETRKEIKIERPIFDLVGAAQRVKNPPWQKKRELHSVSEMQPPELQRIFVYSMNTGGLSGSYTRSNFETRPRDNSFEKYFENKSLDQLEAEYNSRVRVNQFEEVVAENFEDSDRRLVPFWKLHPQQL